MPITLITTPAAVNANSFADVDRYKAYWETRLYNTKQLALADNSIAAVLVTTTKLFNLFIWTGAPTTKEQALPWPRINMLSINGNVIDSMTLPEALLDAHCEWAGQQAVSDLTATNATLAQGIERLKAGSVEIQYAVPSGSDPYATANIAVLKQQPELAYLQTVVPDAVRQLLVPSWYEHDTIMPSIILEVHQ